MRVSLAGARPETVAPYVLALCHSRSAVAPYVLALCHSLPTLRAGSMELRGMCLVEKVVTVMLAATVKLERGLLGSPRSL